MTPISKVHICAIKQLKLITVNSNFIVLLKLPYCICNKYKNYYLLPDEEIRMIKIKDHLIYFIIKWQFLLDRASMPSMPALYLQGKNMVKLRSEGFTI